MRKYITSLLMLVALTVVVMAPLSPHFDARAQVSTGPQQVILQTGETLNAAGQIINQAGVITGQVTLQQGQTINQANQIINQAGQVQGTVNQVKLLPGQIVNQSNQIINQATGQVVGQVTGLINQVELLPGQIVNSAGQIVNQVTGQVVGQVTNAINEVKLLPGQVINQAGQIIDSNTNRIVGQVKLLPGQIVNEAGQIVNQVTGQIVGQLTNAAGQAISNAVGSAIGTVAGDLLGSATGSFGIGGGLVNGAIGNGAAGNTVNDPTDVLPSAASTAVYKTLDAAGNKIACKDLAEAKDGAILGTIIPCMTFTIEQASMRFTAKMVAMLAPLLSIFLTLVVILYGIRILQHEPDIYKQVFLLLLKIAIVSLILSDLGNVKSYDNSGSAGKIIATVYQVMGDSQAMVTGALKQSLDSSLTCEVNKYGSATTPEVWKVMDCVLGKLFGYTIGKDAAGNKSVNMLGAASLFGLLTGFMFSGTWGVVVFFGMVSVLMSLFVLVLRTAVAFLSSYLLICFLFIISPLLLPLIFLRATAQYYEATIRLFIGGFITPIIVTAYSLFALMLYDKMLFAPNSVVQLLFKYENVKAAERPDKTILDRPITGDANHTRNGSNAAPTPAQLKERFDNPMLQNWIVRTISAGNNVGAISSVPNLETSRIKGFGDTRDDYTNLFTQLMSLLIIAWIMNRGLETIPQYVQLLVGTAGATEATGAITGNMESMIRGDAFRGGAFKVLENSPGGLGAKGATFIRGLPGNASQAIDMGFKGAGKLGGTGLGGFIKR